MNCKNLGTYIAKLPFRNITFKGNRGREVGGKREIIGNNIDQILLESMHVQICSNRSHSHV